MILKNYEVVSGFYKWALGKYIELIVKSIIYYWNAKIKKKEKPVLNSVQSLMKKKNDEVDDDD